MVRARPPISPDPSTTIGRIRVRSSSSNAAVRPAGPAPMTTAVPLLYDIRDRVDHTESVPGRGMAGRMGVKSPMDESDCASRSSTLPLALAASGRCRTDGDHTGGPPPGSGLELLSGAARATRGVPELDSPSSPPASTAGRAEDAA